MECIVTIIWRVFIYFVKCHQMVEFSRVGLGFIGANLYIAMTPPKLHSSLVVIAVQKLVPYVD